MKKRLLATITTLCLLVGLFPAAAFASDTTVTEDGQYSTDLQYTAPIQHTTEDYQLKIPTSISWSDGDTSFRVELMTQPSEQFNVKVSVDSNTFNSPDNPGYIRLNNTIDSECYVDFALAKDNGNTWINGERNDIATFNRSTGSSTTVNVMKYTEQLSNSNDSYSGTIIFNVESFYN